jgi:hypothetical protein
LKQSINNGIGLDKFKGYGLNNFSDLI